MSKPMQNPGRRTVRHSPMEHPAHQYPQETAALQEIARSCGLVEAIKWGKPCFLHADRNIVLIQRFNDYIALLFFQGALLQDPEQLLMRVGQQQAPRQLRFRSLKEITRRMATIRAYILQAIALEESGARVAPRPVSEVAVPQELQTRLDAEPALRQAFARLTPGRQKGYLYHISAAKQSKTRTSRVDACISRILSGNGLND